MVECFNVTRQKKCGRVQKCYKTKQIWQSVGMLKKQIWQSVFMLENKTNVEECSNVTKQTNVVVCSNVKKQKNGRVF